MTLLIGQDNPSALTPLDIRKGNPQEPFAVRTVLGWTLNGPLVESDQSLAACNFIRSETEADVALSQQVERFWKLDVLPTSSETQTRWSQDNKKAVGIWENSASLVNGHYQLDIPFKNSRPELPNNRNLANMRLSRLRKRLASNPELLSSYRAEMDALLKKGSAERVTLDMTPSVCEWYLPHHNVVNPRKPERFRIVFDLPLSTAELH